MFLEEHTKNTNTVETTTQIIINNPDKNSNSSRVKQISRNVEKMLTKVTSVAIKSETELKSGIKVKTYKTNKKGKMGKVTEIRKELKHIFRKNRNQKYIIATYNIKQNKYNKGK